MSRALGAALAAVILLQSAAPVAAAVFDLLYIKANVGESAGGHSAIRFADQVYHFQNDAGGLLHLRRTPNRHFRWTYAVLQNRTIHVARVEAAADTYDRLRDAFNRRFLLHDAHTRLLRAHTRDRELLDALIATREPTGVEFPLRGAGLFSETPDTIDTGPPRALATLRARVSARYGATFIAERLAALHAQLRHLAPTTTGTPPRLSKDVYPTPALHISERYQALGLQILALDILRRPRSLAPGVLLDPGQGPGAVPDMALSAALRRQLQHFAERTEDRLVTLAGSDGPDWGFAFLLGMARLEAIYASQAAGRLMVLDGFPDDARTIDRAAVARRRPYLQELADEADARFISARTRLLAADPVTERDFALLEATATRRLELWRGAHHGDPVRMSSDPLLPARRAHVPRLPALDRTKSELRRDVADADLADDAYRRALRTTFGYHLLRANCATEIFALIATTLEPTGTPHPLGGHLAPTSEFHFVPALAHRAVLATWNVTAVGEIPSYRRTRVDAMYDDEPDAAVYFRESSRLTSTVYRANDADAFFLFFTDDSVPMRPLYGLANVAAGTGQALWGTLRAPFDRGATLRAGMAGIAFSLPELVWVNLRKGTFEYGHDHVDRLTPTLQAPPTRLAP